MQPRLPPTPQQRPPRLSKLLAEALEHLVRGIVDSPDDVKVSAKNNRRGDTLEVRVHQDDLGRVIGRQGRTARALRTVVAALADDDAQVAEQALALLQRLTRSDLPADAPEWLELLVRG